MSYKIFATSFFKKRLKKLAKKYRQISSDYHDLINHLKKNPQSGDKLKGCLGPVFKIRMSSQDMQKGKSGGFRVIYLLKESDQSIFLLTLYAKSESENIHANEINSLLKQMGF